MAQMNRPCSERTSLGNGLVLIVSSNQRLPLVSLNAFVLAGQDQNPMPTAGLAAMTSRLLDEGTERYTSDQISEIVEGAGGNLSTFSQRDLSGISLQLHSDDLEMGLDLMEEMLRRPVFPEDRLELERMKVLSHLRALDDDPQTVGGELLSTLIYRGCPLQYPILGTPESVGALTREDLRRFHRRLYGPQSVLLVLAGDIDPDRALDLVSRRFADWTNPDLRRDSLPGLVRQVAPMAEARYMDKEQIHIFVGHLGVARRNPDYLALQVMDVILGSGPGFTSRIPRKLRDEQGLAYSTYSDISGSAGLYPGRFVAYISTSVCNHRRALSGLLSEIDDLVTHGVSDEEVAMAHDYLVGSFVFDFQSNLHIARFLATVELFGLGEDYAERYPALVRAVTREEVNRVARLHLDTINYTTVSVGPTHDQKWRKRRPPVHPSR